MQAEFKKGDPAIYVGNGFPAYKGLVLTVESDLMWACVRTPSGQGKSAYVYLIRFCDGKNIEHGMRCGAFPSELKPVADIKDIETETEKELELKGA